MIFRIQILFQVTDFILLFFQRNSKEKNTLEKKNCKNVILLYIKIHKQVILSTLFPSSPFAKKFTVCFPFQSQIPQTL